MEYFLLCMQYIEMNPGRADMVDHPAKYRWSSFAANALGETNHIIRCHAEYLGLGNNMTSCRKVYRQLFEILIDKNETQLIQQSLHSGTPVGNEKFQRYIERVTGNTGTNMRIQGTKMEGREGGQKSDRANHLQYQRKAPILTLFLALNQHFCPAKY